jgi:hypothetical protein
MNTNTKAVTFEFSTSVPCPNWLLADVTEAQRSSTQAYCPETMYSALGHIPYLRK